MSDPDLTPAQDQSVREHLASLRHTDPVPAPVIARLDGRLAELVEERRQQQAPVVTLASRRRRLASTGLLAAAAAVVLGVGVTQILGNSSGSGSDGGTTAGASEARSSQSDPSFDAQEPGADAGAQSQLESEEPPLGTDEKSPSMTTMDATTALVSTAPLGAQLRAVRRNGPFPSFATSPVCAIPGADLARQLPVTYDAMPAVVVYGATDAGRQRVDVHLCGEREPLRTVRLPSR